MGQSKGRSLILREQSKGGAYLEGPIKGEETLPYGQAMTQSYEVMT